MPIYYQRGAATDPSSCLRFANRSVLVNSKARDKAEGSMLYLYPIATTCFYFHKDSLLVLVATVNMVRLFTIIILLFTILCMQDATAVLCVIWSTIL